MQKYRTTYAALVYITKYRTSIPRSEKQFALNEEVRITSRGRRRVSYDRYDNTYGVAG